MSTLIQVLNCSKVPNGGAFAPLFHVDGDILQNVGFALHVKGIGFE
jgi:hypothetical protein